MLDANYEESVWMWYVVLGLRVPGALSSTK
jgi:hypothetical protein